jgi:hypothetical protein
VPESFRGGCSFGVGKTELSLISFLFLRLISLGGLPVVLLLQPFIHAGALALRTGLPPITEPAPTSLMSDGCLSSPFANA